MFFEVHKLSCPKRKLFSKTNISLLHAIEPNDLIYVHCFPVVTNDLIYSVIRVYLKG